MGLDWMDTNPITASYKYGKQGLDALGRKGSGGDPYAMLTPEQMAAHAKLAKFMETGEFGAFKAGADLNLGLGDFEATGFEKQGLSGLQALLSYGIPDQYEGIDKSLAGFMDTSEAGIDKQFSPFKALSERAGREADAAVRRNAGFAGSLYSTDTIRKLGDVSARTNETQLAELARLTEGALGRKLTATGMAMDSARSKEEAQLGRIAATQEFGSLTRRLNDQAIKARDGEILRRRAELQMPIQAATSLAGAPVQFGVTPVQQSPYMELLGMAAQIGGTALGQYAGGRGYSAGMRAGAKPPVPTA